MVQCNPFPKLAEYYPSGMFSYEYRNIRRYKIRHINIHTHDQDVQVCLTMCMAESECVYKQIYIQYIRECMQKQNNKRIYYTILSTHRLRWVFEFV